MPLPDTLEGFTESMVEFYREFGVGTLGLHKAFRVAHDEEAACGSNRSRISRHVNLEDLVGYEIAKAEADR